MATNMVNLSKILDFLMKLLLIVVNCAAEHERMAEAYSMINQKLQNSISEQANLEKTIQELKVVGIFNKTIVIICIYLYSKAIFFFNIFFSG